MPQTHPEASRLISRIRSSLQGDSGGLETAKLAWHYANAIDRANERIAHAHRLVEEKRIFEAYSVSNLENDLIDTIATLGFLQVDAWKERCIAYGWECPQSIDTEKASHIESALSEIDDKKEWLFGEYRTAVRGKSALKAYTAIKLLSQAFPDDPNIREEFSRQEAAISQEAEKEIAASINELIPREGAHDAIERYQSAGFVFDASTGISQEALDAEKNEIIAKANQRAATAVDAAAKMEVDDDWQGCETRFLECDYFLATTGTRGEIEAKRKETLEKTATALTHKRGDYESKIRIQLYIDELNKALAGKGGTGHVSRKNVTIGDTAERLKTAQMQMRKQGFRVSPEKQKEIDRLLSKARRKRIPKLAILVAGTGGAALLAVWLMIGLSKNAEREKLLDQAIAAIEAADRLQQVEIANDAVETWATAIDSVPPDSPLATQAKRLVDWIAKQRSIETEYSALADRLDTLEARFHERDSREEAALILDEALDTRTALASDLGSETDQRFDAFRKWRSATLLQEADNLKKDIELAVSKISNTLNNAHEANNSEAFGESRKTIADAIAQAKSLAERAPDASSATLVASMIGRANNEIEELERKWAAFTEAQNALESARSAAQYIDQLERIQSFNLLATRERTAIDRVLRAGSDTDSLLRKWTLPSDANAWLEFSSEGEYAESEPSPSEVERLYLERLATDRTFANVYSSKVKYFEGEAVAKSEYSVFLLDPVSKDQTGLKTGVNYNFKVRGFDEAGEEETRSREMNFLSHPDGSFWGFFYEPSELSRESEYFANRIRPALLATLESPPRFALIELIQEITRERDLAPAFRIYWQQQILSFMELDPWKWGFPLSPSLETLKSGLKSIAGGGISKRQWLSSIEQTVPSVAFSEHLRKTNALEFLKEARSFAAMYAYALEGEFAFVGFADESGTARFAHSPQSGERIWSINPLSGEFDPIAPEETLAPYSPLLAYRFEGKGPEHILAKTRFTTGFDLSQEGFLDSLPPLFESK